MGITTALMIYFDRSLPPWNIEFTKGLVEEKWKELTSQNSWHPDCYSTAGFLLNDSALVVERLPIPIELDIDNIYLEMPSHKHHPDFYKKNGLKFYTKDELDSYDSINILSSAFKIIGRVRPVFDSVTSLVKAIQVLKSDRFNNDISYSHPKIRY